MFWNNEFLNSAPSAFDALLQSDSTKLSDIIFQEDLLQELRTSNLELTNYLSKPEIINELVDNITNLTEKDCYEKQLYSKVHSAYISCEILTAGISDALLSQSENLVKIISCLVGPPSPSPPEESGSESEPKPKPESPTQPQSESESKPESDPKSESESNSESEPNLGPESNAKSESNPNTDAKADTNTTSESPAKLESPTDDGKSEDVDEHPSTPPSDPPIESIKVVPQKAALVSKLISSIHASAPADLSCPITKNIEIFSSLVQVLVNNIDVSGSFEILSTFISRTNPPEIRYVFCEVLSKLNFVFSLINVMTLSNVEDKQRNACQLLCDLIVIGRQEANEQQTSHDPAAQDMLAELIESKEAVHLMLTQMFRCSDNEASETDLGTQHNKTAIVCGMKVLQTLVEEKHAKNNTNLVARTVDQIQDEIAENLIHFHDLLLNPPKQEPIKTTFGVIQKPLGYIRLEVVNLIRELLRTGSPVIIKKLVELKTFKIIIDLFVDYSWNNLLHTQVEQAVHLIIKNCRRDEDLKYQVDMQKHSSNNIVEPINYDLPSLALLSQLLNECDLICRLLFPNKNGEQANFGHIIQMINSISISCDLDTIKDHLNEMKDKHPDLYARWTNFVNVDVASFKAISLYFDVQSMNNHTDNNYEYLQKRNLSSNDDHGYYLTSLFDSPNHHRSHLNTLSNNSSTNNDNNVESLNGDDQIMTYFSFTKETVIPSINVDVLPKSRRRLGDQKCPDLRG